MEKHGLSAQQASDYSFLADGNLIEAKALVTQDANDNADLFAEWLRMGFW
jgi:DNA polymerase-3 subunit delta'